ncbi:MAG: sulfotransferase [Halobacteria archaeon]|nr:sulfotransferase [Halobacteria archaeon]
MSESVLNTETNRTDEDKQPIMLISTERSGSNLVRSILNTHPEISAPHPLETAYPWQRIVSPGDMSDKRARKLLRDVLINKNYSFHPLDSPISVDDVYEEYEISEQSQGHALFDVQKSLYNVYAEQEECSAWASKYPALWEFLDDIFDYYEKPKFVYLVRDVRDVVLSFKTSNVGRYHPYFNAKRWYDEQTKGAELLNRHDESVHLLRYKDLLQDPESVVKNICDFLEMEYDERMLYYYETEEAEAASESADVFENLTSPIMSDNYDKFHEQLPEEEIKITEKIAGDILERFGYERTYNEDELAEFEIDKEKYRKKDKKITRRWTLKHWRESPREQIRRQMARSFSRYMILRYGVFG